MKKVLLLAIAFSCWAGGITSHAQQLPPGNGGKNKQQVTDDLRIKYKEKREKALKLAKEKNWTVDQVLPDGTVISLQGVNERGLPEYYITDNNTRAAATIRTNELWTGGILGLNLDGSSHALAGKLGIWDGGALRGTHQELAGRTVNRDGSTTLSDHATHVAGTMIATGVNPLAKGMSHKAANIQSWDFNADTPEMAAASGGLLISNHSYGSIAGWRLNGTTWEFWGAPGENEDFKFGQYSDQSRDWDLIAYTNPYHLIAKASGNNRSQNGPAVGQPYSRFNGQGIMVPAGPRPAGISNNDGYDIISTYGNAKNILTVGAVQPIPGSYQQPSDVKISSFSSWGPTDDGRIKPDVVGNGAGLLSSIATADDAYAVFGGTSMSAPNVSGSLFLLQEHYSDLNGGKFMRAATLKGLAIHSADEAGVSPGPDYIYGWGLVNTSRAAQVISNNAGTNLLEEKTLAQGATETIQVTASGAGPLVVTISWTDPEGTASAALNDRTIKLVNDLDVRVSKGTDSFLPWVLNPASPASAATMGDNIRDNVEQVLLANAVPGETYTITVSHKGTLARGPQAYSIIASGIGGKAVCASSATSDADSRINSFSFGTISNTPAAGCTSYSDFTSFTTGVQIGQSLPLSLSLGTCGIDNNKIAKVFIDWNADNDFDDADEEVALSDVISGTGDFNTTVNVPSTVEPGKIARLRVVLVETSDPSEVAACGTYGKGETQDYLIRFELPGNDVGITGLVSPDNGICANADQGGIAVTLRNFGTSAQGNIPVQVVVSRSNGQVVATLSATYTRVLPALSEAIVKIPGAFEALAGETYTFTSSVSLDGDANQANNQRTDQRSVSGVTAPPTELAATVCGNGPVVLKGQGNGTIFWYDAAEGGELITAGNNTSTTVRPTDNTYYGALNELNAKAGLSSKEFTGSGGGYNQFGPTVNFTAQVPFVFEKARLYIGNSGTITFTVSTLTGNPVSSVTLDVTATRTVPGPGSQTNDPNDQGAVYDLNLAVPAPGNYQIGIEYGEGATIYRNNAGIASPNAYPYTVPGVMSITSSSAGVAAYYYLYDIQLKALGCPSSRVAVEAVDAPEATAVITPAGPTNLCLGQSVVLNGAGSGEGMTYQWFLNGTAIANATSASLTATVAGNYTLQVTNGNGCSKTSAPVNVKINRLPSWYVITAASSTEFCAGQPVSTLLLASSDVTENIAYQWFRDGVAIAGANLASYPATETGNYSVEYLNEACGKVTAAQVAVTQVTEDLMVSDAVICSASGSTTLKATSSSGAIYWYDASAGGKLLATGPSFNTPVLSASASYYVGLNDRNGTLSAPSATTDGSFSAFTGGRMYFDAEVPFVLEKATINVTGTGTMTVIIVDKDSSNSIIASRVIPVTAGVREYDIDLLVPKAGKNYGFQVSAFSGGVQAYRNNSNGAVTFPYKLDGVMSITGNNQGAQGQSAFYYFLYNWKVKAAGCATAVRKKVDVTVAPPPVAVAGPARTICSGQSAVLGSAAEDGLEYSWSPVEGLSDPKAANPTVNLINATNRVRTVTYALTVADAVTRCSSTDQVMVTVNPLPVAAATTDKSTVYFGYEPEATATLTGSVTSGKEPYTYLWSNGATTATTAVSPQTTTTYTVTVTDAAGCISSTASVTVRVVNVRCGNNPYNLKVLVCNKDIAQCVAPGRVANLLRKGATLGACGTAAARVSAEDREAVSGAQVNAWPNPFSRSVTIDIVPESSGYATYEVSSPQGVTVKRLFAGYVESGKLLRLEMDGSSLSSGVYVGRFISEGNVHTLKLVLKK